MVDEKNIPEVEAEIPKVQEQPGIEEKNKILLEEKEKQIKLIQEKNKILEEELKGKSYFISNSSKEDKITEECNAFLKSTGFKI
jgi:hypothetical protein